MVVLQHDQSSNQPNKAIGTVKQRSEFEFKKAHTSPRWVSYGLPIVRILDTICRVTTGQSSKTFENLEGTHSFRNVISWIGHWAGLHTDHTGAGNMSDLDKSMDKMIPIFGTHMDWYTKNMAIHIS